jgi:hypothetical protein
VAAGVLPFGLDQYFFAAIASTIALQFIGVLASARTLVAASICLMPRSAFAGFLVAFFDVVFFADIVRPFLICVLRAARRRPPGYRDSQLPRGREDIQAVSAEFSEIVNVSRGQGGHEKRACVARLLSLARAS